MLGTVKRACASLPFSSRRRASSLRAPSLAPPAPVASLAGLGFRVAMAHVLELLPDGRPRVRLLDGELTTAPATWALPYRYRTVPGDVLWVVSDGAEHYVLAVARGAGRSELWFDGEGTLAALGSLHLRADRTIRVAGRTVSLRAAELQAVAQSIQQRVGQAKTLVRGLSRLITARATRVTEGRETLLSQKIRIIAAQMVKIDATQIKLL